MIHQKPEVTARLRLWLRLLKCARITEAELRERLRQKYNTTLPRFDVLAALWRHRDGLRMSELSGALQVSNGNVTGIIERLVADKLVERQPVAEDRRAMVVRLTRLGEERFEVMAADHAEWINEIFGGISPEETETISRLISGAGIIRAEKRNE